MFAQLLENLGFVIGLFFGIISLILVSLGVTNPEAAVDGYNLNLLTGLFMMAFSAFMIGLAVVTRPKTEAETSSASAKANYAKKAEMIRQPS